MVDEDLRALAAATESAVADFIALDRTASRRFRILNIFRSGGSSQQTSSRPARVKATATASARSTQSTAGAPDWSEAPPTANAATTAILNVQVAISSSIYQTSTWACTCTETLGRISS
jgi:hypothetical protein